MPWDPGRDGRHWRIEQAWLNQNGLPSQQMQFDYVGEKSPLRWVQGRDKTRAPSRQTPAPRSDKVIRGSGGSWRLETSNGQSRRIVCVDTWLEEMWNLVEDAVGQGQDVVELLRSAQTVFEGVRPQDIDFLLGQVRRYFPEMRLEAPPNPAAAWVQEQHPPPGPQSNAPRRTVYERPDTPGDDPTTPVDDHDRDPIFVTPGPSPPRQQRASYPVEPLSPRPARSGLLMVNCSQVGCSERFLTNSNSGSRLCEKCKMTEKHTAAKAKASTGVKLGRVMPLRRADSDSEEEARKEDRRARQSEKCAEKAREKFDKEARAKLARAGTFTEAQVQALVETEMEKREETLRKARERKEKSGRNDDSAESDLESVTAVPAKPSNVFQKMPGRKKLARLEVSDDQPSRAPTPVTQNPEDVEVCFGRVPAHINTFRVPSAESGVEGVRRGFWPQVKISLTVGNSQRQSSGTRELPVADCTGNIGWLDPVASEALLSLRALPSVEFRTSAVIRGREKRLNDPEPGDDAEEEHDLHLTLYGRKKHAKRVGDVLSQNQIGLWSPTFIEDGIKLYNPHVLDDRNALKKINNEFPVSLAEQEALKAKSSNPLSSSLARQSARQYSQSATRQAPRARSSGIQPDDSDDSDELPDVRQLAKQYSEPAKRQTPRFNMSASVPDDRDDSDEDMGLGAETPTKQAPALSASRAGNTETEANLDFANVMSDGIDHLQLDNNPVHARSTTSPGPSSVASESPMISPKEPRRRSKRPGGAAQNRSPPGQRRASFGRAKAATGSQSEQIQAPSEPARSSVPPPPLDAPFGPAAASSDAVKSYISGAVIQERKEEQPKIQQRDPMDTAPSTALPSRNTRQKTQPTARKTTGSQREQFDVSRESDTDIPSRNTRQKTKPRLARKSVSSVPKRTMHEDSDESSTTLPSLGSLENRRRKRARNSTSSEQMPARLEDPSESATTLPAPKPKQKSIPKTARKAVLNFPQKFLQPPPRKEVSEDDEDYELETPTVFFPIQEPDFEGEDGPTADSAAAPMSGLQKIEAEPTDDSAFSRSALEAHQAPGESSWEDQRARVLRERYGLGQTRFHVTDEGIVGITEFVDKEGNAVELKNRQWFRL